MNKWNKILYVYLIAILVLIAPCSSASVKKNKHHTTHHYFHWHMFSSPLKGNKNSLIEENEMADREGLIRIANNVVLKYLQLIKAVVPLPQDNKIKIDDRLEAQSRWCRPWVIGFLEDFSTDYFNQFHEPLQINSAVRTIEFQKRLRRTNPNAAAPYGPMASTHPTGSTIDVAKKDMKSAEITWVRNYLKQKMSTHKIHVIEEFHQPVFHIMVSKWYKV